jgi:glutamyl-tRNA reductase
MTMRLHCLRFLDRPTRHAVRTALDQPAEGLRAAWRWAGLEPAEYVVLSTCARLELYVVGPAVDATLWLEGWAGDVAGQGIQHLQNDATVRHLLRVASGLESPILGEHEILGQVREAFLRAQAVGDAGPVLSKLFATAIRTGRRVRSETDLSREVRSYAERAVDALLVGPTCWSRVAVAGTGKLAQDLVTRLAAQGVTPCAVVSRHHSRATQLAASVGSRAASFEELPSLLDDLDAIIACTAASNPILNAASLGATARHLHLIDLGMPPNIAPDVRMLPGVQLTTLGDLVGDREVAPAATAAAERLVEHGVQRFRHWLELRRSASMLRRMDRQAERALPQQRRDLRRRMHEVILRLQEDAA